MKKYRIYKAKAMNEQQQYINAKDLQWESTEMVFEDMDEAYVQKVDLQLVDEFFYYGIREE